MKIELALKEPKNYHNHMAWFLKKRSKKSSFTEAAHCLRSEKKTATSFFKSKLLVKTSWKDPHKNTFSTPGIVIKSNQMIWPIV